MNAPIIALDIYTSTGNYQYLNFKIKKTKHNKT